MDGPLGFPLRGGVDDSPSDAVHEEDADEGALVVSVCALCHHGQQVGVQALGRRGKSSLRTTSAHCEPWAVRPGRGSGFLGRRAACSELSPLHACAVRWVPAARPGAP